MYTRKRNCASVFVGDLQKTIDTLQLNCRIHWCTNFKRLPIRSYYLISSNLWSFARKRIRMSTFSLEFNRWVQWLKSRSSKSFLVFDVCRQWWRRSQSRWCSIGLVDAITAMTPVSSIPASEMLSLYDHLCHKVNVNISNVNDGFGGFCDCLIW